MQPSAKSRLLSTSKLDVRLTVFRFLDDPEMQQISVEEEGYEHWLPQITKYIFENRIGSLAYECQTIEEEGRYAAMETGEQVQEIEEDKLEAIYRSVNWSRDNQENSPKRAKFFEDRRLSDTMGGPESIMMKSISNFEAIYEEMD